MLYKCYTHVIHTGISVQCHSVKRLSRPLCAVCTLERTCQLTSKVDHGGRHASREVCELVLIKHRLHFEKPLARASLGVIATLA